MGDRITAPQPVCTSCNGENCDRVNYRTVTEVFTAPASGTATLQIVVTQEPTGGSSLPVWIDLVQLVCVPDTSLVQSLIIEIVLLLCLKKAADTWAWLVESIDRMGQEHLRRGLLLHRYLLLIALYE